MLAARRTAGTVGAPGGMAEDSGDARWIKADWRVHVQGRTARRPHIDMADDENTEVEEQPKQVEESGGVLDLNSALQQVLKKAAVQPEGLARGLREAVKALDRKVVRAPTLPCVKIERPSVRARLVAGGRQDQQIAGLFCAGCSGGGEGGRIGGWILPNRISWAAWVQRVWIECPCGARLGFAAGASRYVFRGCHWASTTSVRGCLCGGAQRKAWVGPRDSLAVRNLQNMGRMNRGRLAARVALGARTRTGPHAAVVRGASAQIRARVPSPIQRGSGQRVDPCSLFCKSRC